MTEVPECLVELISLCLRLVVMLQIPRKICRVEVLLLDEEVHSLGIVWLVIFLSELFSELCKINTVAVLAHLEGLDRFEDQFSLLFGKDRFLREVYLKPCLVIFLEMNEPVFVIIINPVFLGQIVHKDLLCRRGGDT